MNQQQIPSLAALRRLVPFGELSDANLQALYRKGRIENIESGRVLFKRGTAGGVWHFLLSGSVDLADAAFRITPVAADSERARCVLDDRDPNRVTAVTTAPVTIFAVDTDTVDLVLTWQQAGSYVVTDLAARSGHADAPDWMSGLLSSRLFAAVPPANIEQLFARFEPVRVQAGQAVVAQGEAGDYFYVIERGRARVTRAPHRTGAVGAETLAELEAGDYFGEDALIGDAPRNATVTMLEHGTLRRLADAHFQSLLEDPVLDYVTRSELEAWRSSDTPPALVDVRTSGEAARGPLPGSHNLPLENLRESLAVLDPDAGYVVSCDGGRRSRVAAHIMSQYGFDVQILTDPPV